MDYNSNAFGPDPELDPDLRFNLKTNSLTVTNYVFFCHAIRVFISFFISLDPQSYILRYIMLPYFIIYSTIKSWAQKSTSFWAQSDHSKIMIFFLSILDSWNQCGYWNRNSFVAKGNGWIMTIKSMNLFTLQTKYFFCVEFLLIANNNGFWRYWCKTYDFFHSFFTLKSCFFWSLWH